MLWIPVVAVVLGLVCLAVARADKQASTRGLGKGRGHAGSARYKNRGSRKREKEATRSD